jgi:hypothetical protein
MREAAVAAIDRDSDCEADAAALEYRCAISAKLL